MIPASAFTSVVLPAPFAPTSPTISPARASSETPLSAALSTHSLPKQGTHRGPKPRLLLMDAKDFRDVLGFDHESRL